MRDECYFFVLCDGLMMLVRLIHKPQARKVKEHKDKMAYTVKIDSSKLESEL